ncbi:hypothetical protein [Roseateles sp. P5_E7]
MKRILMLIALLSSAVAQASLPLEATLEEMAQGADHILVGRVTGVDMVDANGAQVKDPEARTGPGSKNVIRLLVAVDEVLVTNASSVPKVLPVALDPFLHYSLGQIQNAHAGDKQSRLLLLKGKDFVGIKDGVFLRQLSDKAQALRIYRKSHRKAPT